MSTDKDSPVEAAEGAKQASEAVYISNPFEVFFGTFRHAGSNIGHFFSLFGLWAALFLVVVILVGVGIGLSEVSPDFLPISLILYVLAGIIGTYSYSVLSYAQTRYFLATDRDETITFNQLFKNSFKRAIGFLLLKLLIGLAILGGLLLFIVPGIIFYIWFRFARFVYVAEERGVMESLSRSKSLAKGKGAELISISIVGGISDSIVSLPSNIFPPLIFFTLPFVIAVLWMIQMSDAYRYHSAKYLATNNLLKPPTHWTNWLVIGLYAGLLAFILLILLVAGLMLLFGQIQ